MRAVWLWMLLAAITQAAEPLVAVGHIPIAVRDIDAASADYRALGFSLKPGHLHDDSILNNHVKFADGTELELITASERKGSTAAQYLRMLDDGEGPAFLALEWGDDAKVRTALKHAGIGFADGVFFTLTDPRLNYLFFGGDNRSPTDKPEYFAHANSAYQLTGVWIADAENPALKQLLGALGARFRSRSHPIFARDQALEADLARGSVITLLPRHRRLIADRPIIGAVLLTRDLERVAAWVGKTSIGDLHTARGRGYRSLILPPAGTRGLWLEFRQPDTEHH